MDVLIDTPRFCLRSWCQSDIEPFRRMNADPAVMRFFPSTLCEEESDALYARIQRDFARDGFGLWALDVHAGPQQNVGGFAGFVGITRTSFDPDMIEIAWRLAVPFQHKGLATEAAAAALEAGFTRFHLDRIVAFTALQNLPSRRLMQRLGMVFECEFLHPALDACHPLAPHVRCVMTKEAWMQKARLHRL